MEYGVGVVEFTQDTSLDGLLIFKSWRAKNLSKRTAFKMSPLTEIVGPLINNDF